MVRTMSQQLATAVECATVPFQCALTTKSGTECIAHAIQTSVFLSDGIGASVWGSLALPFMPREPFVVCHGIWQGEGVEQGDPMRCCAHSASIRHFVLSSRTSALESLCSRSMCLSFSELVTSIGFKSTLARQKSGTVADLSHPARTA